jgi:hypothetical protein
MTVRRLAFAAAFFAATYACGSRAEVKQLTVPNVTVTAPAPAPTEPPYLRSSPWESFQRNPYFGRDRVEENHFAKVPCAQTRIAAVAGASCLLGYRLTSGIANYALHPNGAENNCDMALDVVIYTVGNLSVEADTLVFDPRKLSANGFPTSDCFVEGFPGYDLAEFQDMNQVTRRGTNFHGLTGTGEAKSIEFTEGDHNCLAIRRPGPRWGGGYTYMMHASICRTDTASLQPDDLARALAPLQVHVFDPNGNLARPGR